MNEYPFLQALVVEALVMAWLVFAIVMVVKWIG